MLSCGKNSPTLFKFTLLVFMHHFATKLLQFKGNKIQFEFVDNCKLFKYVTLGNVELLDSFSCPILKEKVTHRLHIFFQTLKGSKKWVTDGSLSKSIGRKYYLCFSGR